MLLFGKLIWDFEVGLPSNKNSTAPTNRTLPYAQAIYPRQGHFQGARMRAVIAFLSDMIFCNGVIAMKSESLVFEMMLV